MCGVCGCADPKIEVVMTDVTTGAKRKLRDSAASLAEAHAFAHAHGLPHDHLHDHSHDHSHEHDHAHPHDHAHDHGHSHSHDHPHAQDHSHSPDARVVALEAAILGKNDMIAARNRGWFEGRGVLALNFVSSPGSGKTALLEATIKALKDQVAISVIEGDQMTTNDADRIRAAGAPAIQVNTGAGCHLEADMVAEAARALNPAPGSILMIENVGNLVCPAMFDLGEAMKIAVISTTEGEDKPLKYPHMFRAVKVVVINKMDLAPHVGFDDATCRANIRSVNPTARIIGVSARTGENLSAWTDLLTTLVAETRSKL
jgi:hydrogenase nickel incorporation protein HypB